MSNQPQPTIQPHFLKSKDMMIYFNISRSTLDRRVRNEELPAHFYINNQRYWRLQEVEAFANTLSSQIAPPDKH